MFISARFGLLTLRNGKWRDRQYFIRKFYSTGENADRRAADLQVYEPAPEDGQKILRQRARVRGGASQQRHEPDLR